MSTTPQSKSRHRFTVEFEPREGMTPAESHEWIQKFFDHFHPGMKAKVVGKAEVLIPSPLEGSELV